MGNERGQVAPLALGLTLVVLATAGLVLDLSRAFLLKRTLQNAADGAALAAAGSLDQTRYYLSGGQEVLLNPESAGEVARRWLDRRGIEAHAGIQGRVNGVSVTLSDALPTSLLGLVGIPSLEVSVRSVARPGVGAAPP